MLAMFKRGGLVVAIVKGGGRLVVDVTKWGRLLTTIITSNWLLILWGLGHLLM